MLLEDLVDDVDMDVIEDDERDDLLRDEAGCLCCGCLGMPVLSRLKRRTSRRALFAFMLKMIIINEYLSEGTTHKNERSDV